MTVIVSDDPGEYQALHEALLRDLRLCRRKVAIKDFEEISIARACILFVLVEVRRAREEGFSLGGAQGKFALARREGQWFEPTGQHPSTHI